MTRATQVREIFQLTYCKWQLSLEPLCSYAASMAMKLQFGITLFCCALFLAFVLLVTFGFNQTTYSVREDAGNISIGVSVINGTISGDEILTLSTAAGGTATGGNQLSVSSWAQLQS